MTCGGGTTLGITLLPVRVGIDMNDRSEPPTVDSPVRVVPNPKWIRGVVDGSTVVDSRRARFVWEHRYYPAWYFPLDDVVGSLSFNGATHQSAERGLGRGVDLVAAGRTIRGAGWRYSESPVEELHDLVRLEWNAMDSWFEEDVEVFVHPRSPETRVDALPSSRHVTISIGGTAVADSSRPTVLFETGLPPRYYLPEADVRMDLLIPSDTASACPYKGWATYWTASADGSEHVDIAWSYRTPLPESAGIAGLVCFLDERVDVVIDGERVARPVTKFS